MGSHGSHVAADVSFEVIELAAPLQVTLFPAPSKLFGQVLHSLSNRKGVPTRCARQIRFSDGAFGCQSRHQPQSSVTPKTWTSTVLHLSSNESAVPPLRSFGRRATFIKPGPMTTTAPMRITFSHLNRVTAVEIGGPQVSGNLSRLGNLEIGEVSLLGCGFISPEHEDRAAVLGAVRAMRFSSLHMK